MVDVWDLVFIRGVWCLDFGVYTLPLLCHPSCMKYSRSLFPVLLLACVCSCQTLFTGIVTVTDVVDSAMKQWSGLSKSGQTTPELDARVIAAHNSYRQAAGVAQTMLVEYKTTGDKSKLDQALLTAKAGADPLINLIISLLNPTKAAELSTKLAKAQSP